MFKRLYTFSTCLLLTGVTLAENISKQESEKWLNYTLPLPHNIIISGKIESSSEDISVETNKDAAPSILNGAEQIKKIIKKNVDGKPSGKGFRIILGLVKDGEVMGIKVNKGEELKDLPNCDQAYAIETVNNNKIIIYGLSPDGVFYGAQTLRQLLKRQPTQGKILLPILQVIDYPDLACRGCWNGDTYKLYKYLSQFKINYAKNYANNPRMKKNGELYFHKVNMDLIKDAERYAFDPVPIITHLNFLPRNIRGLYDQYPLLAGKGKKAFQRGTNTPYPCPCPSRSNDLVKILTCLLENYAKHGVMEVSVWTTEYFCYCQCEKCNPKKPNMEQMKLECHAIVSAWNNVKKTYPDFKLRILGFPIDKKNYSEYMKEVMKEIPKSVIVEEVYPKYSFRKGVYVNPLSVYAEKGYKVIAYTADNVKFDFAATKRLHRYLPSLVKSKWYGAVVWVSVQQPKEVLEKANMISGINALAEWSWNARGRTVEQFYEAWLTVNSFPHPEKFLRWVAIFSKFDNLHIQAFPIVQNEMPLNTLEYHEKNCGQIIADLEKALILSKEIGIKMFINNTEYLLISYKMIDLLNRLKKTPAENKAEKEKLFNEIIKMQEARGKIQKSWAFKKSSKNLIPFINKYLKQSKRK